MPHEIITVISDIKHYEIIMIFMISLRISRAVPSSRLQSHCTELQITISAFHRLRSTMRTPRACFTNNEHACAAQHNTTRHLAHGALTAPRRACAHHGPHSPQPDTCTIQRTRAYSIQCSSPLSRTFPRAQATPGAVSRAHSAAMLCSVHPESELQQLTAPVARGSERAHT